MNRIIASVIGITLYTFATNAMAHDTSFQGLLIDNDRFVDTDADGHYSAGIELNWRRASDRPDTARGFALGQSIYTPADINIAHDQIHDQPWAGYLYARWTRQTNLDKRQTRFNWEIGLAGKYSGAEWAQKTIHEATGSDRPTGWSNQLKNEVTANLGFQETYKAPLNFVTNRTSWNADMSFYWGGELGTVRTNAFLGATLRAGRIPRHFEDIGGLASQIRGHTGGRYLYASVELRATAHDLLTDGSLIRSGPGIDHKTFGQRFNIGWHYSVTRRITVNLRAELESPRFESQSSAWGRFGTIELIYKFK